MVLGEILGDTKNENTRNGTKIGTRKQWGMMNVSYTRTSNITYVKQQQQDDQMWLSNIKIRITFSLLIWLVQTMWIQSMQRSYKKYQQLAFEITERGGTRVQCNNNTNCYWLLRRRHETSDKPSWMSNITREENKSDIRRNGEESTIWKWNCNKESINQN